MNIGSSLLQEVADDILREHGEILTKIKEYKIFDDEQVLLSEYFELPEELVEHENDVNTVKDFFHSAIFFQVIPGKLYFFLMDATFICVYSEILNDTDVPREERVSSLKSISFEEFLEIVPKELASRYLYHLDFFQEYLQVIHL